MADEIKIVREGAYDRISRILVGQKTTAKLVDDQGHELLAKGVAITEASFAAGAAQVRCAIEIGERKR